LAFAMEAVKNALVIPQANHPLEADQPLGLKH
jgi:hypothetical protein